MLPPREAFTALVTLPSEARGGESKTPTEGSGRKKGHGGAEVKEGAQKVLHSSLPPPASDALYRAHAAAAF